MNRSNARETFSVKIPEREKEKKEDYYLHLLWVRSKPPESDKDLKCKKSRQFW